MKIALLFEFTTLNGGERSMLAVLDWLRTHGSPFQFVAIGSATGRLADALRQRKIDVVNWSIIDPAGKRLPADQVEKSLREIVSNLRPQLLHANSLAMGRLVGRMAYTLGIPVTAHLRDIIKLSASAVKDLNCNQRLVAVSHATRNFHLSQGLDPERVIVVYNGIDLEQFRPRPRSGRLHQEIGLPYSTEIDGPGNSARLIMTIGQIGLRKGLNILVAAAAEIVQRVPYAHFVIIGERNSQKAESVEFERAVRHGFDSSGLSDRLHLLGYRDDVALLLNEADLLVHPAHQEPLGRVILEASASGVPVVATDVGGTNEIIEDEVTGYLVPPNDPATLSSTVVRALSDRTAAKQMGIAARAKCEAKFSIRLAAENLGAVWRHVLKVPFITVLLFFAIATPVSRLWGLDELDDESGAIAKFKLLGGKVIRDDGRPERPVIGIEILESGRFNSKYLRVLLSFHDLSKLCIRGNLLSNDGYQVLSQIKKLSVLELCGPGTTDENLRGIDQLTNLETLVVENAILTDEGLREVKNLKNLKSLDLNSTALSESNCSHVCTMTGLTNLDLQSTQISDDSVAMICQISKLKKLNIGSNEISDEAVSRLQSLRHLKSLCLSSNSKLTDDCLNAIGKMTDLAELDLSFTAVTDDGITQLQDLVNLKKLYLSTTKITDNAFDVIGEFKKLHTLDLRNTQLTDVCADALSKLEELEDLDLDGTWISSDSLESICRLTKLKILQLGRTSITDDKLELLHELKELSALSLWSTETTDAGLKKIAQLTSLISLDLQRNEITDEGLLELKNLKSLRSISLSGTKTTKKGIDQLKEALPDLFFER